MAQKSGMYLEDPIQKKFEEIEKEAPDNSGIQDTIEEVKKFHELVEEIRQTFDNVPDEINEALSEYQEDVDVLKIEIIARYEHTGQTASIDYLSKEWSIQSINMELEDFLQFFE